MTALQIPEPCDRPPRDPAKDVAYFVASAKRDMAACDAYTQYNNPVLYPSAAKACVRVGLALYSGGFAVADCLAWFHKAGELQRRFLIEGKAYKLASPGNIDDHLELFSAAFLAGNASELIDAFEHCVYTEKVLPATTTLLGQYCAFLRGEKITVAESQIVELNTIKKEWAFLPQVWAVVAGADVAAAASALDAYLVKAWGPATTRWANKAIKSVVPEYWGRWSVFSAAACKRLGHVPPISAKAASFLPSAFAIDQPNSKT